MNKYIRFSKTHLVIKYNACGRKKAFDNKEDAYQKGQDSYECYYCGKWHRTSIKKGRISKLKGFSFCTI